MTDVATDPPGFINGSDPQAPDMTDKYNTKLAPAQEQAFQSWMASKGRDLEKDLAVYDMRGFFASGQAQAPNAHFPDTFKKPSHPTFSNESQYHGVDGHEGGAWSTENGKWVFTPGPTNVANGIENTKDYLDRADPDVILRAPQ